MVSMPSGISCDDLLELQCGIIARWQAPAIALDPNIIKSRLRSGRWQSMYWGVYASFTGTPCREASLWAAVLRAGPNAILSHQTAAELDGLTDRQSALTHLTVPGEQHVTIIPGVRVHRSLRAVQARHPARTPPRTRLEETVLDLTEIAESLDVALGWLCRACGSRLTTPERLRSSMASRPRLRWRNDLQMALSDIGGGAHSMLELRYVRDVERPHALPVARRQAAAGGPARRIYRDNLLARYRLCVELDGQAAHPSAERWRDIRRDNASAADGIVTLRYSWTDITERPCQTAAQIVLVLRQRGWTGTPRACRPGCPAAGL
jgi:hypothetical protein